MEGLTTFRCGHAKTLDNRAPRGDGKRCGYGCKMCKAARTKRWLDKHPEHTAEVHRRARQQVIVPLLNQQAGLCAICEETLKYPYLDHNHKCCARGTKGCARCKRGLLCPDCNTKLAALEKPGWLEKAQAYLHKWNAIEQTEE